jgi:hypothetical protein
MRQTVLIPISDQAVVFWRSANDYNYQNVDSYPDPNPDELSAYNGDNTNDYRRDILNFDSGIKIPKGSKVLQVKIRARLSRRSGSSRKMAGVLKVGGTVYDHTYIDVVTGTANTYPTTFENYDFVWTTNPKSASPWKAEDINGIGANAFQGFGYGADPKATFNYVFASQCYLAVDWIPPASSWII